MNQSGHFSSDVVVIQPIDKGLIPILNEQDGLYHLQLKGIKNGEAVEETQLIDNIRLGIDPYLDFKAYLQQAENPDLQFVISNTTEAGIAYVDSDLPTDSPPSSFPAKVAVFLHHRFQFFNGDSKKGLTFFPCELIDKNGEHLHQYIKQLAEKWGWSTAFIDWLDSANTFYNTLVDRIVPGFPRDNIEEIQKKLGFSDQLVVVGEQFHLWVIEGPQEIKLHFPADKTNLNVIFTDDLSPYRTRKVRILNGAHTLSVPTGYLFGNRTVQENTENPITGAFLRKAIYEEIIPTLEGEEKELQAFAEDVIDRFRNPFIKHLLSSIALNSTSKYKTRVLPSLLKYNEITGKVPKRLALGLAALICFYKGSFNGEPTPVNDIPAATDFFNQVWGAWDGSENGTQALVKSTLSHADFWNQDLNQISGLGDIVSEQVSIILDGKLSEYMERLG
ncbi:UNVERIFIED_CONTAM: hypothetical protein GTU68_055197 [Idotea baltica]|nr:hypothetical protein [Idotea baltica]